MGIYVSVVCVVFFDEVTVFVRVVFFDEVTTSHCVLGTLTSSVTYGVATISQLLKNIGLFCRISSLL